jgi:hypothetical protein
MVTFHALGAKASLDSDGSIAAQTARNIGGGWHRRYMIKGELRNLADAAARSGYSPTLTEAINIRRSEARQAKGCARLWNNRRGRLLPLRRWSVRVADADRREPDMGMGRETRFPRGASVERREDCGASSAVEVPRRAVKDSMTSRDCKSASIAGLGAVAPATAR